MRNTATSFLGYVNTKTCKTFGLLLLLLLLASTHRLYAAITVSPAFGGTNICGSAAANGSSPTYTSIGSIVISEGVVTDFTGGPVNTLTISTPAGWQFNTGASITLIPAGSGLALSSVLTATSLTITATLSGTHATSLNSIVIVGLQVQATTTASAAGNITNTAQTAGAWTGLALGTNFGSLSQTPQPGAVTVSGGGTFCASNTTITASGGAGGTIYYQGTTSGGTSTATPSTSQLISANGTYYFRAQTIGGCWGPEGSATVVLNPVPALVTVSGGGTFCGNTTITASGGAGGTIYFQGTTSGGTSTATPSTSQVVSSSGTYYFRSRSAAGCWGAEGSVSVTINPNPGTVTVSGAGAFCGNTTITASGGAGGTIYYQGTTSGGTSTATPSTSQLISSSGTYYFRAQTALGCWGVEGSAAVTINAIPAAVSVSGAGTFCGSTTITASGGGGGTIYFQGTTSGGTSTATPSASQVVSSSGTYYFRSRSAAGCWGVEGSVTVTINPNAGVVTVSGAGSFCGNTTITASGGAGGTIYYQGTTSGGTSTATPSTSQLISSSGTYYFRARTALGCWGIEGSAAVTINAIPAAVSVSGAGTFCGSTTITASGGAGGTIYFQGTTSGGTSTASPGTSQVVSSSGTYYFRSQSAAGCWGAEGSVTVTINPNAGAVTVTGGGTFCTANTTITASGGAGGTIYFQGTTSGGTSTATPSTSQIISSSGTYYFRAQTALGCWGAEGSVTVTFNTLPTVASITPSTTNMCVNNALTLTAGSVTGTGGLVSYNWTGPNSYSTTTSVNNAVLTPTTTAASGNYTLTVTYPGTGCTSAPVTSSPVTVNALPTVASITPSSTNLCVGAVLTLNAGSVTGTGSLTSYNWTGPNGYSTTTAVNSAAFTTTTVASSGVYSLSVTYPGTGCNSSQVVTAPAVTVNALPTIASITASPTNLCVGSTINLTAGSTTGAGSLTSYNWTGPNTFSTTTATGSTSLTAASTAASGVYSLSVTYPGTGCTSALVSSSTVTVNNLPTVASITASPTNVCVGSPLTLTAGSITGTGSITSYNWTGPNSYSTTTAANSAVLTPTTTASSGVYTLTVTYPGTGCTSAAVVSSSVSVLPPPNVYNVTGGGAYCSGGSGVHIGLDFSLAGISYQLKLGASNIGSPITGTASGIDFGFITGAGTYTVLATNISTSCTSNMAGSATVVVNSLPTAFNMTGGGTACAGTAGVTVGLSNSVSGINYQLYNGASTVGSPVAGTGAAISFGAQTTSGTYTVLATDNTTSCTKAMNGTAVVVINPAPTAFNVTGGGSYCAGGTGVAVGLSNSVSGINYQLYNGASTVGSPVAGTGAAISFGLQTTAATYTVLATNTSTTCTGAMTGSATVIMNALPTAYNVTGGGSYCSGGSGVAVGLSLSTTGINYQLYNGASVVGSPVAGTGSAISFGSQTTAGTYTVLATNVSTTCTVSMTGSAVVVVNVLPTAYSVTGGGSFCAGGAGVAVGLGNSTTGINYQLYNGASTVGSPVAGTGSAISFGAQAGAGTYTVLATNTSTGCINGMSGSATVVVNPLPTQYAVTGGGDYCAGGSGVAIGLTGSDASPVTYQLYNGASATGSPVTGTGAAISFGSQTASGTYSVVATNTVTACTSNMLGSTVVVIDALPTQYAVTGGGNYCAGGAGVTIGLASSTSGINYQLYNGASASGASVPGTGAAISFGTRTASGTYTVLATNGATGCTKPMTGSAVVVINPLPTVQTVSGGGTYCENGSGVDVSLSNSETGVNYQLYVGASATGSPAAGTGAGFSFGLQTVAGTYTAVATNATTGCTSNMTGSAVVIMNPAPTAYNVTGGGSYCAGGTGLAVGLSNSATGFSYQLYRGATTIGSPMAGTGSALSFGLQTTAGTYTILATNNTTSCTKAMTGSAVIVVNALPTAYSMTGGGSYCAGGTGLNVGVSNSQTGINYQLYRNSIAVGSALSGTGSAIDFGLQTVAGIYSVLATNTSTGCTKPMSSVVTVVVNALPVVYNVTGGGPYCSGSAGSVINLDNSEVGVNYQLYMGAAIASTSLSGSGAGLSFGSIYGPGTYSVLATNSITGCTSAMAGIATVSINSLPTAFTITGGGNYCAGGTGVALGLSGSATNVNYQLYVGATAVGSSAPGTGSAISFGLQTVSGTYTALATSTTTGCTATMTGTAAITINPSPTAYTISGGGPYCPGTSGSTMSLSGSNTGIMYQLKLGATAVGGAIAGTGSTIGLGTYTTVGTYSVTATNIATGCTGPMAGTVSISTLTAPTAFAVTGGGNYCTGGSGVAVGVASSQTGVTYQLYNGATALSIVSGTGAAISFGLQTSSGSYSVRATNTTTGCVTNMTGSVTVTINALPTVYLVTGGGSYCAGGSGFAIVLNGSTVGVNYQLMNGSTAMGAPVAGTGTTLNFGLQTVAGFYSVIATNATTGCVSTMAASPEIIVQPLPTTFSVTGGGSYCSGGIGVVIALSGSGTGTSYQLYNGSSPVGGSVSGSGGVINFGPQTTAGTYSVAATNTGTGCTRGMSGTASVIVNPLPATFSITGGGNYCSGGIGVAVGLNGSEAGVGYQLYNGTATSGASVAGTGSSLNFGLKTATGTYSIVATNATTGCVKNMTGTAPVGINALPTVYSITGGGSYCSGGAGANVTLSSSDLGINYSLYNGSTLSGSAVAGTGSVLDFGPQTAGTYTVLAVNATTSCQRAMSGSVSVSANPAPIAYTVTGGGAYCSGGAGQSIGLSNSQAGVSYVLYNGAATVGSTVSGTGSAISFGTFTASGTYSVLATNGTTSCSNVMANTVTITVNPLPTVFAVTGGGNFCIGGTGVVVGLAGSQTGVVYQLYNGTTAVGSSVAGTGSSISFGAQTGNGVYTVRATNSTTSCTTTMSGSATVNANPLPLVQTVSGGGTYCSGGTGAVVVLSGSSTGVSYQLYNGATAVGSPVAGLGFFISLGTQTMAGTYTVLATNTSTGCTRAMSGSAVINVNPTPTVYTVTGGGAYCAGGAGMHVGISGSQTGVMYTLHNGSTVVGSSMTGTGSALDFGAMVNAGTYTVSAMNSSTTCAASMMGSAAVVVNPLPTEYDVIGGGAFCTGSTGVNVALSGSDVGVNYQLYNGSSSVGVPVSGTGDILDFGSQTVAGTYSVSAVNATSSCARDMANIASVIVNTPPIVYSITGGGNYCAGSGGVHIGVSGSQAGVNYRLYMGATLVTTAPGTGGALDFGLQSAVGTYNVIAENTTSLCTSSMTGTVAVGTYAAPDLYTVSAGGNYCAGATGFDVSLGGSATGVTYQLYNGTAPVGSAVAGTGSAIDFGMQIVGTYSVRATDATTSCSVGMTGTSVINVNTLPTAFTVTGSGSYCAGGAGVNLGLGLSQTGVTYTLYNASGAVGGPVTGTGSAISFGSNVAGTYSVIATDVVTGCQNTMSGTATVTLYAQPIAYNVTGGGNFCAGSTGVSVSLSGSQSGVNYRLYNGATAVGTLMAGTGSSLNFGPQSTGGTYTVLATNATTTCTNAMTGSATVVVNALPTVYNVTGGGSYCPGGSGVNVDLSGSESGISYQLYNGSSMSGSALVGTGSTLAFGSQTGVGNYSVVATNLTTSCSVAMAGAAPVALNTPPSSYTLVSSASSYCAGGPGVIFSLTGSQSGVIYQLFNSTTAASPTVAGAGTSINFGYKTLAGTYTVKATDLLNGCTITMAGSPTITISPLPDVFTVSGGGAYCGGGSGLPVGLSGSQSGVNYQLYLGAATSGSSVGGTGAAITFGPHTAGTYTVLATNPTTTCKSSMSGSAIIVANPLPTAYAVTGGGQYCTGGSGLHVGLGGSSTGIQYKLYNGSTAVTGLINGTGAALDFGVFTVAGTYTVMATNTTTACSGPMTGGVTIIINPLPAPQTVTGGGNYCAGGTGVAIGLGSSIAGINYRLYNGATAVGTVMGGTGSTISFGAYTATGTYTVLATDATTSCTKAMTGSATVGINPLPIVHNISGGGNYCAGGSGVAVGLISSTSGISYKLYRGGSLVATTGGTGGAATFGLQTATGTYSVLAVNPSTGCEMAMAGTVTVGITPAVTPSVILATSGGDTSCAGASVSFSTTMTNGGSAPAYEWRVNNTLVSTGSSSYNYVPSDGDVVKVTMTSNAECAVPATVADSNTLTVLVNQLPTVTAIISVGNDTMCLGTPVTFSASGIYTGSAPVFTWFKNGSASTVGNTFTYTPVDGDVVYCRLESNYRCRIATTVNSARDTLSIVPSALPAVSIAANPGTTISSGQSVTLTANTMYTYNPTYQWYINGGVIHGATNTTFTYNNYSDSDSVACYVTNHLPCGNIVGMAKVMMTVLSTGVGNVANNAFDLRVMPNPTNGDFTIKGAVDGDDDVVVEITDMLGQVVYNAKVKVVAHAINERIHLNNMLANGMYIVNVKGTNASKAYHLMLQQ